VTEITPASATSARPGFRRRCEALQALSALQSVRAESTSALLHKLLHTFARKPVWPVTLPFCHMFQVCPVRGGGSGTISGGGGWLVDLEHSGLELGLRLIDSLTLLPIRERLASIMKSPLFPYGDRGVVRVEVVVCGWRPEDLTAHGRTGHKINRANSAAMDRARYRLPAWLVQTSRSDTSSSLKC